LLGLDFQAEQDRTDRQLVTGIQCRFFLQVPIDPHAVSAAKVAYQDTIICRSDTTVAARNLR
jgi:hypothetical protein